MRLVKSLTQKTLLLALIILWSPVSLWSQVDTSRGDHETHTLVFHDLSELLPGEAVRWNIGKPMMLIPFYPFSHFDAGTEENLRRLADTQGDNLVDMMFRIIGEERFDHNGLSLNRVGRRLAVTGPAALQSEVAKVLQFMKQHLCRKIELNVDLYIAADAAQSLLADKAAVERAVQAGKLEPLMSAVETAALNQLVTIRSGRSTPVVWDFDPEIAQGSFVSEPIINPLFTGIKLQARPFLAAKDGKLIVNLACIASRLTEAIGFRDLECSGRLTFDNGFHDISENQIIDDPQIEFASLATTVVVESGRPVVFATAFPHRQGLGSLVGVLTARWLSPASVPSRSVSAGGTALCALDCSHLQAILELPKGYGLMTNLLWERDRSERYHGEGECVYLGPKGLLFKRPRLLELDFLMEEVMPAWTEEAGENAWFYDFGRVLFHVGSGGVHDRLAALFNQTFSASNAESMRLELLVTAVGGPALHHDAGKILKTGHLIGAVSVPVKSGGKLATLAGLQGLTVEGYDVDVANEAACPNPNVNSFLDGMQLVIKHDPSIGGAVSADHLSIGLVLNRLVEFRSLGMSNKRGKLTGTIDLPVFERGTIEASCAIDGQLHLLGTVLSGEGESTIYVLGRAKKL